LSKQIHEIHDRDEVFESRESIHVTTQ